VNGMREKVQEQNKPDMLNHLPRNLDSQDYPIQGTQKRLKDYFDSIDATKNRAEDAEAERTYEERILRVIVQELQFSVLEFRREKCRNESKVAKIFSDIFRVYQWAVTECNVFHRDISINNLMFREVGEQIRKRLDFRDYANHLDGTKILDLIGARRKCTL